MRERDVKQSILRYIKRVTPTAIVYCIQDRFTTGIPDIYIQYAHDPYWIEVKKDDKSKQSKHALRQWYELAQLEREGAIVGMVSSLDEFKRIYPRDYTTVDGA